MPRAGTSSEHRSDDRDESIDVALRQVVLAARVDERPVERIDPVARPVVEERRDGHLQRAGDLPERLEVGRSLAALDHAEKRDADVSALAQLFLRELGPDARRPQLADLAPDVLDQAGLTHRDPVYPR